MKDAVKLKFLIVIRGHFDTSSVLYYLTLKGNCNTNKWAILPLPYRAVISLGFSTICIEFVWIAKNAKTIVFNFCFLSSTYVCSFRVKEIFLTTSALIGSLTNELWVTEDFYKTFIRCCDFLLLVSHNKTMKVSFTVTVVCRLVSNCLHVVHQFFYYYYHLYN